MGKPRTWCGSTACGNKSCFVRSVAITARCYDSYGTPQVAVAIVARILWGEAPAGLHAIRDGSISLGARGFRSAQPCVLWFGITVTYLANSLRQQRRLFLWRAWSTRC